MIERVILGMVLGSIAWGQAPIQSQPMIAKSNDGTETSQPVNPDRLDPGDRGDARSLPGVPSLPTGKVTLIGGTIQRVDQVRDRLTLQAFAGGRMRVLFDERTRLFRDGRPASLETLRTGDRAYVDTMLDGTDVFARSIRLLGQGPAGQSNGQIVDFDARSGDLTLRVALSPEPVVMKLGTSAKILSGDRTVDASQLRSGTLVALSFSARTGKIPTIDQVSILASPGTEFTFVGRLEHLDVRRGLMVLTDPRDNKSYDVYFDPQRAIGRDIKQGASVTVKANFDGKSYKASDITVNAARSEQREQ